MRRRGVPFQHVHALVATPFGSSVGKPNLVFNEEISPRAEFPLEVVFICSPPAPPPQHILLLWGTVKSLVGIAKWVF